ncbi:uncharacterized protein LOC125371666 [Haliotis rufescens]|uniref:uncharacterized protein LOC125371666 n=1 Tax=Haliotis rufescens TaxID=6454 RepID=UPI00201EE9F0|nr:uncharacterized protein LOC125371666 [Haliotis rufescens]
MSWLQTRMKRDVSREQKVRHSAESALLLSIPVVEVIVLILLQLSPILTANYPNRPLRFSRTSPFVFNPGKHHFQTNNATFAEPLGTGEPHVPLQPPRGHHSQVISTHHKDFSLQRPAKSSDYSGDQNSSRSIKRKTNMDLPQVSRSISEQPSSRSQLDVSPIDKVKPETRGISTDFVPVPSYLDRTDTSASKHNIKENLKRHISFWKDIEAPEFIIRTIMEGYIIPFVESPPLSISKNNASAVKHSDFVSEAIQDLLLNNCIVEVVDLPQVVNPLSVSINSSGKKRLILDLRVVNKYVWKEKIVFEDYKIALDFVRPCGYMYKFDLKSGYHHIDIHPSQHTFLGFSWSVKGVQRFYCFTVLPFGLTSAPYIFTKCFRPLVRYWRKHSVDVVIYLDDGFGFASSEALDASSKGCAAYIQNSDRIFQCLWDEDQPHLPHRLPPPATSPTPSATSLTPTCHIAYPICQIAYPHLPHRLPPSATLPTPSVTSLSPICYIAYPHLPHRLSPPATSPTPICHIAYPRLPRRLPNLPHRLAPSATSLTPTCHIAYPICHIAYPHLPHRLPNLPHLLPPPTTSPTPSATSLTPTCHIAYHHLPHRLPPPATSPTQSATSPTPSATSLSPICHIAYPHLPHRLPPPAT